MTVNQWIKGCSVLCACLWLAVPASAGRNTPRGVFFFFSSVSGSLGGSRNSLDGTEYIGCQSTIFPAHGPQDAYFSGSCTARKGLTSITCAFPDFAQSEYQLVLSTITSDSFISFSWDPVTLVCNSLYVGNYSFDTPKL